MVTNFTFLISEPDVSTEPTYDSSSGIVSDNGTYKSTSKMSGAKGDNSSLSSTDRRYSDSSFDRQFSDSSVSVDKSYVKKRQGEGKFPWAYTPGAKIAQQNQSNAERTARLIDPKAHVEYRTPVINHSAPPPYEYHLDKIIPAHARINQLDLQDTEKLMLTSGKGKSKHIRPSPFDLMTDDVIVKIFSHLSTDQICRCSCVCDRWYRLAWDPLLWKQIVINDDSIPIDRALRYLTKRLSYNTPTVCVIVERINLNGCEKLTDKGLHFIAKRCPELRNLEIKGCANITNTALCEVVSYCVNLEYLDITGKVCSFYFCLGQKLFKKTVYSGTATNGHLSTRARFYLYPESAVLLYIWPLHSGQIPTAAISCCPLGGCCREVAL